MRNINILVEVVVTNLDSGHVAVHQESMDLLTDMEIEDLDKALMKLPEFAEPKRVGPLLIVRNALILGQ